MNDRMPYATSIVCFLAGGIAGGIAGAAVALLWAPQSGRATGETVARKLGDTADSARDSARQIKDRTLQKGEDLLEEAAQRVCDAAAALSRGDGHKPGGKRDKSTSVKRRPGVARHRSPFSV